MLINTYIEVDSQYSGWKKLQRVELYAETKPDSDEIFYKIQGTYVSERFAILITEDRIKAEQMFYRINRQLLDRQVEEAKLRQKESA